LAENETIDGIRVHRILSSGEDPGKLTSNIKRIFFADSVIKVIPHLHSEKKFDVIHLIGSSLAAAPELKKLKVPLFATIESYPSVCPKGDRMYKNRTPCEITCTWKHFVECQSESPEIGKMKNQWYIKNNPVALRTIYAQYQKLKKGLDCCHLIAISGYVQRLLQLHGKKSVVIPNAIDLDLYKRERTSTNAIPEILYLGSLTHYKGPMVLLEAVKGLPVHTSFYGDGPLRKSMLRKIKEDNINANIYKSVPYEKVPELYVNADVVVFPSIWPEPFGRISIEAQAAGKIVIASDVGGIKETVFGDALFESGGAVALRKKISCIHNSQIQRKLNQYSLENVAKKLVGIYTSYTNCVNH